MKKLKKWSIAACCTSAALTVLNLILLSLVNSELTWLTRIVTFSFLVSYIILCSYFMSSSIELIEQKKPGPGAVGAALTCVIFLNPISLMVVLQLIIFTAFCEILTA